MEKVKLYPSESELSPIATSLTPSLATPWTARPRGRASKEYQWLTRHRYTARAREERAQGVGSLVSLG